jgi:hypothetical protein
MNFLKKLDICVTILDTLEMMHELPDEPELDNLYKMLRASYNDLVADLDPASEWETELRGVELYGLQNHIFVAANRYDCAPFWNDGFVHFGELVEYGGGNMLEIAIDAISESGIYPPSIDEFAESLKKAVIFLCTDDSQCHYCGGRTDEVCDENNEWVERCGRCGYEAEINAPLPPVYKHAN